MNLASSNLASSSAQLASGQALSWFQQLARAKLLERLNSLHDGVLRYSERQFVAQHQDDDAQPIEFGAPSRDSLTAQLRVDDARFFSQLAVGGSIGFAESYMRGHWHTDNLTDLLRMLYRNRLQASAKPSLPGLAVQLARRIAFKLQSNTIGRSRRHIAAHYDLSNDFFELFLDSTWMYSSAYFENDSLSLAEASEAKLAQICRKLDPQPQEHVLEIGTGWGGFALHLLQHHDVRLTTTTISESQRTKAVERVNARGLANRVELLNVDYRQLHGQFDKLVSIEMIEAVGEQFLPTYFRQCDRLLRPGGRMVMQAIVMPEQRYTAYRKNVDFIQQYIFPGGFLPSISALQDAVGAGTDFRLIELEDLSLHYARTLAEWRKRFVGNLAAVRQLGFDDRFIRMWEYYLCYCEAGFREQAVRLVQIVWDKPMH
ncbi:MAG: class I SAM-dependent methyltransferase [Planctomycetales bacterium]|nr:class I SAM-dependent methyltransferase [Planctomycetales bacterium]